MSVKMNVTPEEFANLQLAASNLSGPDFASFVHTHFGCKYWESYEVVVRKDVPSVPWFSAGVPRFSDDPVWGAEGSK